MADEENPKISSFTLERIIGRNISLPVLMLPSNKDDIKICFAAGNILNLFSEKENFLHMARGHVEEIVDISADSAGKYIVSADKRHSIIIWNFISFKLEIVRSIPSPFGTNVIDAIALSADAKYLAAVSSAKIKCCLKFWFWTDDSEEKESEVNIPSRFGSVRLLRFNRNLSHSHFIVATFEKGVALIDWNFENSKLRIHIPENPFMSVIQDSTYVDASHRVVSITKTGYALLFSDNLTEMQENISNEKKFLKSLKMGVVPLTALQSFDKTIAIADEMGRIKFYDQDLKFLYHYQHFETCCPVLSIEVSWSRHVFSVFSALNSVPSFETYDIVYEHLLPRDSTIEERPFLVRNFIVTTKNGKVLACNIAEGTSREIYLQSEHEIVSMDVHPVKNCLCTASKFGRLAIYDLAEYLLISEMFLNVSISKTQVKHILYSHRAEHLVMTTDDGKFYELDPEILTSSLHHSYDFTEHRVEKLKFSDFSNFLALSDCKNVVFLLECDGSRWSLKGKCLFHTKQIKDLLFIQKTLEDMRLFSIADDMFIVEYDLNKAMTVLRYFRYDQNAIPEAISLVPLEILPMLHLDNYHEVVLITDNQMKIKLVDLNSGNILFTYLGPVACGRPITYFKFLQKNNTKFGLFASSNGLGLYLFPIDGNPKRAIATTGCSNTVNLVKITKSGTVCVLGQNDFYVSAWKINEQVLADCSTASNSYFENLYLLLPGGKSGYCFQELLDHFYYLQLLGFSLQPANERKIDEFISTTEIVDYMRGVSFFPSDFEIRNMLREMEILGKVKISFEELVKLYINHRPVNGTRHAQLEKSVMTFFKMFPEGVSSYNRVIQGKFLVKIMTEFGEKVDQSQAVMCLKELWYDSTSKSDSNEKQKVLMSTKVNIHEFINNLLGLGLGPSNTQNKNKI